MSATSHWHSVRLQAGADVHARDMSENTAMHLACEGSHERVALLLLASGASLLTSNAFGERPLRLLSLSAYRGLPARLGGCAFEGPPFPDDPEPWRRRKLDTDELSALRRGAKESMAVRIARCAKDPTLISTNLHSSFANPFRRMPLIPTTLCLLPTGSGCTKVAPFMTDLLPTPSKRMKSRQGGTLCFRPSSIAFNGVKIITASFHLHSGGL